jgi:hypothetical protein
MAFWIPCCVMPFQTLLNDLIRILNHMPQNGILFHMLHNAVLNPVPHDLIQPRAGGIREHLTYLRFEWFPRDVHILNHMPQNGILNHMLRNAISNTASVVIARFSLSSFSNGGTDVFKSLPSLCRVYPTQLSSTQFGDRHCQPVPNDFVKRT